MYQNNYQNNYGNSYGGNRGGRQTKKHSGAKESIQRKGKNEGGVSVHAWIYRKGMGLVKITAFENAKSTHSSSDRGNKFVTMMFEMFYKDSGNTVLEVGNYCLTTGKVYLEKPGWVISTKAPNGGYCGPVNN